MELSGLLILDKPAGCSSHDVVDMVRRRLAIRRVGHAGTLDPDATGVLVVCVGRATRLLEYAAAADKEYQATALLGVGTETDDAAGAVTELKSAAAVTAADVRMTLASWVGCVEQTVPKVSAVRIAGRRAYDLARAGESFAAPRRQVHIHRIDVTCFRPGSSAEVEFSISCSKGTYIRSLCRDVGTALGVPAHLKKLRRTRSGTFTIAHAIPVETWLQLDDPLTALHLPGRAVETLPRLLLSASQIRDMLHGRKIEIAAQRAAGTAAAYGPDGVLIAIVQVKFMADHWVAEPKKVLWKEGLV